ncbi:hypothetical protein CRE_03204 [Caenorhabditis remanei]|uniref:Uncharacterized protein n=1 Tax=Caenorhabditis remanei TaxID=31234 RepID=E3MMP6_CAERE|nr:hypothetical protein CRE_03204 [Caenorhabditis remanei]
MLREGPAIILDPATRMDLLKMTVQTFLFSICSIAQTDIFFFLDRDRKSNTDSNIPFMHNHLYIIIFFLFWDPIIILVSGSSYCKHKISKFIDLFRGTNEDFDDPACSIEMSTIA